MRNEPIYKKRRKYAAKWILGVILIGVGILNFNTSPVFGGIIIAVGIYIVPIVQKILNKEFDTTPSFLKYAIVIVGIGVAFYLKNGKAESKEKPIVSSAEIKSTQNIKEKSQSVALDLSVELRNNQKLGKRAEIWIKNMGSWYLNNQNKSSDQINKFGLVSTTTPKLDTNKKYDLYFYPYGRNQGKEIKTQFKLTPDFCPNGCTVYALSISVFQNKVKFFGKAIKEAHGQIEITKDL